MKSFDVFDSTKTVFKSLLLEASAGTGKTFSIENIVLRALIESESADGSLSIDRLLVVTFTKAAASELKMRIRKTLLKAACSLEGKEELSPYLRSICEKGPQDKLMAIHRLKQALVDFDHASIATIHSFCFRAIKEHGIGSGGWISSRDEQGEEAALIAWEVLADVFRSKAFLKHFSRGQQQILLKRHSDSPSALAGDVVRILMRGLFIAPSESNQEIISRLCKIEMEGLTGSEFLRSAESDGLLFYGASEGRKKTLKSEFSDFFHAVARLIDRADPTLELLDQLAEVAPRAFKTFSRENIKKTVSKPGEMPWREMLWLDFLEKAFRTPLTCWGSYSFLLLRLAYLCQKRLWKEYEKRDEVDFSYILMEMERLASEKSFQESIQRRYRLAIVDEFQDTDPIQWNIFKKLFHEGGVPLILVGDPKQSIYSFRSADVYTYLDAASTLGEEAHGSLLTNYRSSPQLLSAFNELFDERFVPGWLSLPAIDQFIPYKRVSAPAGKDEGPFADEVPLQFLKVDARYGDRLLKMEEIEERFLFPHFAKEINRLREEKQIPFSKIAFLVRDHAQSDRLAAHLRGLNFPVLQQRSSSWTECPLLTDLIYLLRAILNPGNLNLLYTALGTRFFMLDCQKLAHMLTQDRLLKALTQFNDCKEKWRLEGIAAALESFLAIRLAATEPSVEEQLLSIPGGEEQRFILSQILEWLVEKEKDFISAPEALLCELEAVACAEQSGQENFKLKPLQEKEAIPILTLHMSKGLEFDVVFALGVIKRSPLDEAIVPLKNGTRLALQAVSREDSSYHAFLKEVDAEKSRQLYVAFTRAKHKLYVPAIEGLPPPKRGKASPLELLIARMGHPLADWEEVYHRLESLSLSPLEELAKISSHIALEEVKEEENLHPREKEPSVPLVQPPEVKLHYPKRYSASFTSLAKQFVDEYLPEGAPSDFAEEKRSAHSLPAGSATGELLHLLLEKLPLELVQRSEKAEELFDYVQGFTQFSKFRGWEGTLAEMIFSAFKRPFGHLNFSLSELEQGHYFREMPFMYPAALASHLQVYGQGCGLPLNGEVRGVIDLAFSFSGKYYLLDWKSNWLGKDQSFYDAFHLEKAMKRHRYELQAELYKIAYQTYLKAMGALHSKDAFGGVYYLFLRGFDGAQGLHLIPGEDG